jgi:hypothetical protein
MATSYIDDIDSNTTSKRFDVTVSKRHVRALIRQAGLKQESASVNPAINTARVTSFDWSRAEDN